MTIRHMRTEWGHASSFFSHVYAAGSALALKKKQVINHEQISISEVLEGTCYDVSLLHTPTYNFILSMQQWCEGVLPF